MHLSFVYKRQGPTMYRKLFFWFIKISCGWLCC